MRNTSKLSIALIAACLWVGYSWNVDARPPMGGMGSGGARGGARPAMQPRPNMNMARPAMPHPSMPSAKPNFQMPNMSAVKPNLPAYKPSPSTRPGGLPGGGTVKPPKPELPTPRPGLGPTKPNFPGNNNLGGGNNFANRPMTKPTGPLGPTTKPGPGNQFSGGGPNRPNTLPGMTKPSPGERPTINPPGGSNRPKPGTNFPGGNFPPGISTKPAERPSLGGGDRPNFGGNRPGIGGINNNNRPIIGGGNNNNIGNNINNNININRPGWNNNNWGGNWNNNNWGGNWNNNNWNNNWNHWNNNHWGDDWYNHHIDNHHHYWYHGCWHGHWGGYYYTPFVYGATVWGIYGLTTNWGYANYVNPYYVSTSPAYDYSQPIVVNNYVSSDANTNAETPTTQNNPSYSKFDEALKLFKEGNYRQALIACNSAIAENPKDPAMHEVRALIQFALGQYQEAAAGLNSLLASAPGMDWTTLSSLYDNTDTYTDQLRLLESYCKSNPKDASAQFVLAYHYLVAGYQDEAVDQLETVVALQPKDMVAKRMLESLKPEDASDEASKPTQDTPKEANTKPAKTEAGSSANEPQTDLVGSWQANDGKGTIALEIDDNFKFTWKATSPDQPAVELAGDLMIQGEMMILTNEKQGNLSGKVASGGVNKFTFTPSGAPDDFKGLVFERKPASK